MVKFQFYIVRILLTGDWHIYFFIVNIATLNQLDTWKVGDVDLMSRFNNVKQQQTQSRFSLVLDGIADVTSGSAFSHSLTVEERTLALGQYPYTMLRDSGIGNLGEKEPRARPLCWGRGASVNGWRCCFLWRLSDLLCWDVPHLQAKDFKDASNMPRCMRDSWSSQIKSISREAVPPPGLTVFGSKSLDDETRFYALDFAVTYRL